MVKTKEEFMELIKSRLPEDMSDDDISFLEDITDTVNDFETRAKDSTDWKAKYEENDREWKQKYTERFFNKDPEPAPEHIEEPVTPKTFEDLFTKGV